MDCSLEAAIILSQRNRIDQTKRIVRKHIQSADNPFHENVHATVISHHVIAPGRSPRSGNVASTKADKRQDGPEQARRHPVTSSRAFSNRIYLRKPERPEANGQREKRQVALQTCVLTVKKYTRRPSSKKKGRMNKEVHVLTFKDT